MNGKELPDNLKIAESYGIKASSELNLEPESIKITIETLNGNKQEVKVSLHLICPTQSRQKLPKKLYMDASHLQWGAIITQKANQ
jgi:hypothetical protein